MVYLIPTPTGSQGQGHGDEGHMQIPRADLGIPTGQALLAAEETAWEAIDNDIGLQRNDTSARGGAADTEVVGN